MAVLALAGPARAEDAPVEGRDGAAVPKVLFTPAKGEMRSLTVLHDGLVPLGKPGGTASGPPLKMFARVEPVDEDQKDGEFWLVRDPETEKAIGWLPKRYCTRRAEAMKGDHNILRKALIVTTARSAKEAEKLKADGKAFVTVPCLPAPLDTLPPEAGRTLTLFTTMFVYADSKPGDADEGYLFVGTQPEFSADDKPDQIAETMVGWVKKSSVCQWKTREAVEWDFSNTGPPGRLPEGAKHRAEPGKVYIDADSAKLRGEDGVIMREAFDPETRASNQHHAGPRQMRFPLLGAAKGAKEPVKGSVEPKLLKVGFAGPFVDDTGKVVMDASQVEEMRGKLQQLEAEAGRAEILFVIDQTASMEKWAGHAADMMEAIIVASRKSTGGRVDLGLVTFADPPAGAQDSPAPDKFGLAGLGKGVRFSGRFPAGSPDASKLVAKLRQMSKADFAGGGDSREQLFEGLRLGIDAFRFSDTGRKMVVLIGDCGSHTRHSNALRAQGRIKEMTDDKHQDEAAELAAVMVPASKGGAFKAGGTERMSKTPIDFYAVHVAEVSDPDDPAKPDVRAFKTQMNTLVGLYDDRLKRLDASDLLRRGYLFSTDAAKVGELVARRFAVLASEIEATKKIIRMIERGETKGLILPGTATAKAPPAHSVEVPPSALQALKAKGINPDFLRANGMQLFYEGYAWDAQPEGARQLRLKYWTRKTDLKRLLGQLERLKSATPDHRDDDQLKALDAVTNALAGDVGESSDVGGKRAPNLNDVVLKAEGFSSETPFMRLTKGEFKQSPEEFRDLETIRKKIIMLECLVENKPCRFKEKPSTYEITYKDKPHQIEYYTKLTPKDSDPAPDRLYTLGSVVEAGKATQWIWLDAEDEFP